MNRRFLAFSFEFAPTHEGKTLELGNLGSIR
jgi:hypothetical protein